MINIFVGCCECALRVELESVGCDPYRDRSNLQLVDDLLAIAESDTYTARYVNFTSIIRLASCD